MAQKTATQIQVENQEGMEFLKSVDNNSVDLVLTDPPYIISRDTGMNTHFNNVQSLGAEEQTRTEDQWEQYKAEKGILVDDNKENYLKYGTIYGKKYSVRTDYGDWDKEFTMEALDAFVEEYYRVLRHGGTLIIFFDLWKLTNLKEIMERHKFKQIRFIEWIKTNPQPLNSKVNYLTNCREIALLGVKGGKPTFNSRYDNAVYEYPLQGGSKRFHPTQKCLELFKELIKKHSNKGDMVIDTFLGGGTTAFACQSTQRNFRGCEMNKEYFDKMILHLE